MARLTEQNRDFLDYYRADPEHRYAENYKRAYPGCKTHAAAKVNACKLLGKAEAQDYLQKKAAAAMEAVDINEQSILRDIIEVKDKCMGRMMSSFVKVTKDGDIIDGEAYDFNANGANKSLELLGRHKKMFTDKVDMTGLTSVEFNFNLAGNPANGN